MGDRDLTSMQNEEEQRLVFQQQGSSPPPVGAKSRVLQKSNINIIENESEDASKDSNFQQAYKEFLTICKRNPPAPARLELEDVSFVVEELNCPCGEPPCLPPCCRPCARPRKKSIVKNVSTIFEPGKLVAIMGASGAGKTTLLNLLAGFNQENVQGRILINDAPRDLRSFRKISSYITQEDRLHPNLTPREALTYAAGLKMWQSKVKQSEAVDTILKMLRLSECADVRTGDPSADKGLSGGQRKRLALAQELITVPSMILMDEPTSGLDALTAYECIYVAKALASMGTTVLCTIHQPSSRIFQLFDEVLVLGRGQIIYHGAVGRSLDYFASLGHECPNYYNPADHIIEVAATTQQTPEKLVAMIDHFKKVQHEYAHSKPLLPEIEYPRYKWGGRYAVPFPKQVFILFKRAMQTTIRDVVLVRVRLVAHCVLGVVAGLVWLQIDNNQAGVQDRYSLILFSLIFLMLLSIMPTVLTFPAERAIFDLEHKNNWYGVLSYFVARSLVDVPFQILFPVIYGAIVYWLAGLNSSFDRFVLWEVVLVLHVLVTQSLGILISCATRSPSLAVVLAPVTAIPQLLFCGFFVLIENIPGFLRWIQWLVYFRYSYEFLAINEFQGTRIKCDHDEYVRIPVNSTFTATGCPITNGNEALLARGIDYQEWPRRTVDLILLCTFLILFRVGAYLVLRLKSKSHNL